MPPYAMDDAALERAVREGGAVVAHPQFLHELMGRDNPTLIGAFLETTPDVGDLFQLTDIWGGNYPSDPDTIHTLANHGLDLNRANWIGRTFLHGCAEKGDVAAARVFLELGADIEAVELEYGGTPLAAAARKGQAEMVRFLLEQGADPVAPAESPWAQPLYWAEKEGHGEVAALLKEWSDGKGASDG
ncbi:MAG: ankyrin repeat domain-containing protein [Gemmatimonadetes bacterium]|nr:ankyrin repeat domain-containing protein [Gemmatimonadota bacterium]